MNANKKYITEITRTDLREIADAANAYGGNGIDVHRTGQGLKIEIDRQQLVRWIKAVVAGRNI